MEEREQDRSGEALEPPASGDHRPTEAEADRILRWRFSRLLAAGYPVEEALQIALRPEVDLHHATSLPGKGCSTITALRILL